MKYKIVEGDNGLWYLKKKALFTWVDVKDRLHRPICNASLPLLKIEVKSYLMETHVEY